MKISLLWQKFFIKIGDIFTWFLSVITPILAGGVSIILFVMADFLPEDKSLNNLHIWLFSSDDMTIKLLVVASFAILIFDVLRKHKQSIKNRDIATVFVTQHRLLVEDLLLSLFERLNYTEKERISVYGETKKCFVLLGRYSSNVSYKGSKFGLYPKGSGCISEAWNLGSADDPEMPSTKKKWVKHQKTKWSMPNGSPEKKNMRPQSIYALRINDTRKNNTPLAVIVFESNSPQKCIPANVNIDFEGEVKTGLTKLLQLLDDVGVEKYIIKNAEGGL